MAKTLLGTGLDVFTKPPSDRFDVWQDLRVADLELPKQFAENFRRVRSRERELGPQRVVGRLRVRLHELEQEMLSHLVLHRGMLLLEHDKQLRRPEDPDPGGHLLGVGGGVGSELL